MVATLPTLRPRFTGEWARRLQPEALLTVCRAIGSTAWRDRVRTPVTTLPRGRWQMLHSHTAGSHLPPLSGVRFTAATDGHARAQLPWRRVARRLERFGRAVPRAAVDEGRWQGHRPFRVEGSGGSMPDPPPLQDACGQPTEPRPGGGVPVARRLGLCHAGPGGLLKLVGAPLLTHDRARVQAVHPSVHPGDGLGAARGLWADAPLARLVQASGHAVRRGGARQRVEVTPGRPLVRPRVRRTSTVKGGPRSRWLTTRGGHDPLVAWWPPTTGPSWLAKETWTARPASFGRQEVRDHIGTPGCRPRQIPRVTTRRAAQGYRVADRAERYRGRWQVATSLAPLKTTRRMDGLPGTMGPGGLQARTVCAIVDTLVRLVMGPSALRHHLGVERISVLDALRWLGAPSTGIP